MPVQWFGRPALLLHATMLAGVAGCAAATWFEWTRALDGHEIAWVYCFEWPLFAVMGVYVWWKLLHEQPVRDRVARRRRADDAGDDDPDLIAWREYLARQHAADPPAGPPAN